MEGATLLYFLLLVAILHGFSSVQTGAMNSGIHCIESEKNALIKFRKGFRNPSQIMLSWMLEDNCNNWKGVECDNTTGHVITLDLHKQFLQGKIPSGYQFATFENSSYVGNPDLCGWPLSRVCSDHLDDDITHCDKQEVQAVQHGENNWLEEFSFYISMGIGFNTSFWVFWATLMLKRSWRYAYMRFLDNMGNKIYVFAAIRLKINKQQRGTRVSNHRKNKVCPHRASGKK